MTSCTASLFMNFRHYFGHLIGWLNPIQLIIPSNYDVIIDPFYCLTIFFSILIPIIKLILSFWKIIFRFLAKLMIKIIVALEIKMTQMERNNANLNSQNRQRFIRVVQTTNAVGLGENLFTQSRTITFVAPSSSRNIELNLLSLFHDVRLNNIDLVPRVRHSNEERPFKRGLCKQEIERLPSYTLNGQNEGCCTCSICLEPYQRNDNLTTLSCFHKYHKSCIEVWLKENRNCPLCKKDALTGI